VHRLLFVYCAQKNHYLAKQMYNKVLVSSLQIINITERRSEWAWQAGAVLEVSSSETTQDLFLDDGYAPFQLQGFTRHTQCAK